MDLYQQLIIEHSKRPHGEGLREPFAAEAHHVNPTCGDEITLRVRLDGATGRPWSGTSPTTPRLLDQPRLGLGPARARRRPVRREVGELRDAVQHMLTSRGEDPGDEDVLGDAVAFAGVAKYPARVKCALLSWSALADAVLRA